MGIAHPLFSAEKFQLSAAVYGVANERLQHTYSLSASDNVNSS